MIDYKPEKVYGTSVLTQPGKKTITLINLALADLRKDILIEINKLTGEGLI